MLSAFTQLYYDPDTYVAVISWLILILALLLVITYLIRPRLKHIEQQLETPEPPTDTPYIQFHLVGGSVLQFKQETSNDLSILPLFVAAQEVTTNNRGLLLFSENTAYWLTPGSITHIKLGNTPNARTTIPKTRRSLGLEPYVTERGTDTNVSEAAE